MKSKTKATKASVDIDRKIGAFTERLGASLRAMIGERLEATLSYVHDAVIGSMTAPLVPSPPLTVDSLLEAATQTQSTRPAARAKRKARAGSTESAPVIEIPESPELPDSGATEREPRKRAQMACRKVYVDQSRNVFRSMIMCHMIADSLDDLYAMARPVSMIKGDGDYP